MAVGHYSKLFFNKGDGGFASSDHLCNRNGLRPRPLRGEGRYAPLGQGVGLDLGLRPRKYATPRLLGLGIPTEVGEAHEGTC